MLDRILNKLLKLALNILETSDVGPSDIGSLHNGLTESRRGGLAQSELRIIRLSNEMDTELTLKFSMETASEFRTSASIVSSSRSMSSIFSRICWRAASEQRDAKSAPTYPWHSLAT